jgi:hypothetical protein
MEQQALQEQKRAGAARREAEDRVSELKMSALPPPSALFGLSNTRSACRKSQSDARKIDSLQKQLHQCQSEKASLVTCLQARALSLST